MKKTSLEKEPTVDDFDIPKLLALRKVTQALSTYMENELNSYIATLAPLFHPRLVFGAHVRSGKQNIIGANQAFSKLQSDYETVRKNKLLARKLEDLRSPMDVLSVAPQITPVEYYYAAENNTDNKKIRIISPLKWLLEYKNYGFKSIQNSFATSATSRNADLQASVLHLLMMHQVIAKKNGVGSILKALRYQVTYKNLTDFNGLSVIQISCPFSTYRPSDELIIQSTGMSGTPAFEEVINIDDIANLNDPFKERLKEFINAP